MRLFAIALAKAMEDHPQDESAQFFDALGVWECRVCRQPVNEKQDDQFGNICISCWGYCYGP